MRCDYDHDLGTRFTFLFLYLWGCWVGSSLAKVRYCLYFLGSGFACEEGVFLLLFWGFFFRCFLFGSFVLILGGFGGRSLVCFSGCGFYCG